MTPRKPGRASTGAERRVIAAALVLEVVRYRTDFNGVTTVDLKVETYSRLRAAVQALLAERKRNKRKRPTVARKGAR
jgi:hypothetical protein